MNKAFRTVAIIFLALTACAHSKDVRPGDDGINRVVIQTDNPEAAARKCIKEANYYCEKHGGTEPKFITEDKKYTGDMKEEDYKDMKRVSAIAKTVGGAVWVFGGRTESAIGSLGMLGGAGIDAAVGKGYTVEMKFRCR